MKVNWQDDRSHIFLNPKLNIQVNEIEIYTRHHGHIWLATSGTTSSREFLLKLVGLSKKAILNSSQAVNRHIQSDVKDTWLQILPWFHIGAQSIYARASLSGAQVIDHEFPLGKWDAKKFSAVVEESQATLTSLVPTQVYDLVRQRVLAPRKLRLVFVGGSELEPWLYREAVNLGWPVLPTYGMTECASQVASAEIGSPQLKVLDHLIVKITDAGRISVGGHSLLTEYCLVGQDGNLLFVDPKINGEFITEDFGSLTEAYLQPMGRGKDFVKVGGEGVYLNKLRGVLHDLQFQLGMEGEFDLVAARDERLGNHVELVAADSVGNVEGLVEKFNSSVMPFERVSSIRKVPKIQRNELGKLV